MAPIALLVPRFWRPKWIAGRPGPDVAEIGPVRGFGPKSGCADIAAECPDCFEDIRILGNPDFLKKSEQISSTAATPVFGPFEAISFYLLNGFMVFFYEFGSFFESQLTATIHPLDLLLSDDHNYNQCRHHYHYHYLYDYLYHHHYLYHHQYHYHYHYHYIKHNDYNDYNDDDPR